MDDLGERTVADRTTVYRSAAIVHVQAPTKLRKRILAIRTVTVDARGCATADPISRHPGARPDPAVDVRTLTGVRSVSACRYDLVDGGPAIPAGDPTLFSSIEVTGATAARAIEAIGRAPKAGGQDRPENCTYSYGKEIVVLLVRADQGVSRVHVLFSGCDHSGVDDGVRKRQLTRAGVHPFLVGANKVRGWSMGPGKAEALG